MNVNSSYSVLFIECCVYIYIYILGFYHLLNKPLLFSVQQKKGNWFDADRYNGEACFVVLYLHSELRAVFKRGAVQK